VKKQILSILMLIVLTFALCGCCTSVSVQKNNIKESDIECTIYKTESRVIAAIKNNSSEILPYVSTQAVFFDEQGTPIYYRDYHVSTLLPGITEYATYDIEVDDFNVPFPYADVKINMNLAQLSYTDGEQYPDLVTANATVSNITNELIICCSNKSEQTLDSVEVTAVFYQNDSIFDVRSVYFGPLVAGEEGFYSSVYLPDFWDAQNGTVELSVTEATAYSESFDASNPT